MTATKAFRNSGGELVIHTGGRSFAIIDQNLGGMSWYLEAFDTSTNHAYRRPFHKEPATEAEAIRLAEAWLDWDRGLVDMERVELQNRDDLAYWQGRCKRARRRAA